MNWLPGKKARELSRELATARGALRAQEFISKVTREQLARERELLNRARKDAKNAKAAVARAKASLAESRGRVKALNDKVGKRDAEVDRLRSLTVSLETDNRRLSRALRVEQSRVTRFDEAMQILASLKPVVEKIGLGTRSFDSFRDEIYLRMPHERTGALERPISVAGVGVSAQPGVEQGQILLTLRSPYALDRDVTNGSAHKN